MPDLAYFSRLEYIWLFALADIADMPQDAIVRQVLKTGITGNPARLCCDRKPDWLRNLPKARVLTIRSSVAISIP